LFGVVNIPEKTLRKYHLFKSEAGDVLVDVPRSLIRDYVAYLVCFCSQNKKFAKYKEIVDMGSQTFDQNLDLIFLIKRLKMNAMTCYQRLTAKERKLAAELANYRPLKPKIEYAISSLSNSFEKIESITF